MWCIPPKQDAAFVADMENVLEVYARPYDPAHPVICMDEQPKQLIRESRQPEAGPSGQQRIDHEYIREGVCCVWMFNEPLGGWRSVRVSKRRTAVDWAGQVQALVDHPRYAQAEKITLICDHLNTHSIASLYQAYTPDEAMRLAKRLDIIHTPKHGSWLNTAECELSVLTRQALGTRMSTIAKIQAAATCWQDKRNTEQIGVDWHFTTADARIKLKQLYPNPKI